MLRVLQYISTKIDPSWVQSINQADLLRSRPLLQLRFSSDSIANVAIMLIVDRLLALVERRKICTCTFSVLPDPARKAVRDADVQDRMISIRDNINPETVIAGHR